MNSAFLLHVMPSDSLSRNLVFWDPSLSTVTATKVALRTYLMVSSSTRPQQRETKPVTRATTVSDERCASLPGGQAKGHGPVPHPAAEGGLSSPRALAGSSLCICALTSSPSGDRGRQLSGLRAQLKHLLKGPASKCSHTEGSQGSDFNMRTGEGGSAQPPTGSVTEPMGLTRR